MSTAGGRRTAPLDGPDYYPTPPWAVRALLAVERFEAPFLTNDVLMHEHKIYEPCCGDGSISKVLIDGGHKVVSSDLHDTGYGMSGIDALSIKERVPNIITNPPFNLAEEMVRHFISICDGKTAVLLRMSFAESARRYQFFKKHPPRKIYVNSERISMAPKDFESGAGGTVSHAWFVWDARYPDGPVLFDWLPVGFKRGGKVNG